MRRLGHFLRDLWFLTTPYFRSEEKWSAFGLLGIVLAMNFVIVGLHVVLNFWQGAFFNALQEKDVGTFFDLLVSWQTTPDGYWGIIPSLAILAALAISLGVVRSYLRQLLQIRWRRWMTARYQADWLAGRAYYSIQLQSSGNNDPGTDNPDQRISDDVRDFVESALVLGLELVSQVVSVLSFLGVLWELSGPATFFGVTIPGYMVWAALLYSIAGTLLTQWVGNPLVRLNFVKQRLEADFRYALVRLRENAEGVALYGGEADEARNLTARFAAIVANFIAIMRRNLGLNALISGYMQISIIFPYLVAAPRYFSGQINFGQLQRVGGAFAEVQGGLSWIIDRYADLAEWSATVNRLATFRRTLEAVHAAEGAAIAARIGAGPDFVAEDLRLTLPDGTVVLDHPALRFTPGVSTAIQGRSGAGKSTLFRALAGIWPFGSGAVERPPGTAMFLPQKPYLPLGTLRRVVSYPATVGAYPDQAVRAALADAGLGHLAPELDTDSPWAQRLSGGEQQRVALARALLTRPDWLFLDEATASLDPAGQAELYRVLRERLPKTGIVSIAHAPEVVALHDRQLTLRRGPAGGALLAAE